MQYKMLLWPHANARYQNETLKLAASELRLMLDQLAPEAEIAEDAALFMPCLTIACPERLPEPVIAALRGHSLLYGLFECRADGGLFPVAGRAPAYLGSDLPAILKYKGKTNEMFLQLLINAALYSSNFWEVADQPLELLDPMCGRATSLFVAVNRGWNATGADVDRADLKEAETFLKRYLEYHRFKHAVSKESRTLKQGKRAAAVTRFDFSDTPEHFKDKQTLRLSLVNLDAAQAGDAYGKNAFHIIACDLPYGVRHDAQLPASSAPKGKNWLEGLLARALPGWKAALKPGGAIAVSFNAQTFKLERLRTMMAAAGLEVLSGGAYDQFSHWVEQAITRDIAVCKRIK